MNWGGRNMSKKEAVSEVFWRALKELPAGEREGVIKRMLDDRDFMADVTDIMDRRCSVRKEVISGTEMSIAEDFYI